MTEVELEDNYLEQVSLVLIRYSARLVKGVIVEYCLLINFISPAV